MDALSGEPGDQSELTLEQRRREVMLERLRAVARQRPEVLASVIVQWIDQDNLNRRYIGREMYERRRHVLEQTEWRSHFVSPHRRHR